MRMLLLTPHCSKLLLFFIIFLLSFSLSLSCDSSPLSFTFSPPLRFPFSLHLEFVGLGCDRDAMLGVVGLQWFFVDRASQRWFVVGLYSGSMSEFCDLTSMSFNFSDFD